MMGFKKKRVMNTAAALRRNEEFSRFRFSRKPCARLLASLQENNKLL